MGSGIIVTVDQDAIGNLKQEYDVKSDEASLDLLAGAIRDPEFCFSDGSIHLRVEDTLFVVYRPRLEEFRRIAPMLTSCSTIALEANAVDFRNTFKLLWPSFYYSSSEFDTVVWVSALRISTKFDHPALRKFTIANLENKKLPVMDYLPIAQECDVSCWKNQAIEYLATRQNPISSEEAHVLGMESFFELVGRREKRITTRRRSSNPDPPILDMSSSDVAAPSAALVLHGQGVEGRQNENKGAVPGFIQGPRVSELSALKPNRASTAYPYPYQASPVRTRATRQRGQNMHNPTQKYDKSAKSLIRKTISCRRSMRVLQMQMAAGTSTWSKEAAREK